MRNRSLLGIATIIALTACGDESSAARSDQQVAAAAGEENSVSIADWDARLSPEELERGRLDPAWRQVVQLDTAGLENDSTANPETFDDISAQSINTGSMYLPLYGSVEGPSVLRAQILLDRALFSPGIIDGHWGKNTEKAIYWFQDREGLGRTGRLDEATFDRLVDVAGGPSELVRPQRLTDEDVAGPFVSIPEEIYEKAELECLCYESLREKLAELFHTSPDLLEQLNPDVDLSSVTAGDEIQVPDVRSEDAGRGADVARLAISADGFYVHALDASDRIVYHFPSTLGSSFDPSPTGDHRVTSITPDPWWHYQPDILEHVDDDEPDAKLPPGPNNAVGLVWMSLSIPHYGIHGTSAPETIGYTTSAGCVRLTNWDALFLADRIEDGIPVEFTAGGEERG
ncbi:MAG: L,D-transpeptidase [Gemmatimonadota bacterium]